MNNLYLHKNRLENIRQRLRILSRNLNELISDFHTPTVGKKN